MTEQEPTQEELDKAIQDVINEDKMRRAIEIASLFVNLSDKNRIELGDALIDMSRTKKDEKK